MDARMMQQETVSMLPKMMLALKLPKWWIIDCDEYLPQLKLHCIRLI
jgi:hypothetical protein